MPSILFNTMPKSGSIYVTNWLMAGLGVPQTKIAVCLFPDDLVIREKMDEFVAGNFVCQQHLPAKDINLRFIATRLKRMVVHVRDPRQATLSWVHHLDNFYVHREIVPACRLGLEAVTPALPVDYFSRTLTAKIDYQIVVHFPALIDWASGWSEAQGKYGLEILYTSYEEMVSSPQGMVSAILDHCGIPLSDFDWSATVDRTAATHFRKGEPDEWESVFTDRQKKECGALIPANLSGQFGWRRP